MVVKYGNIILLMETLINGTCYKVSTDVLYRLGFLSTRTCQSTLLIPINAPAMWKRIAGRARPCRNGMGHSCPPEKYGSQSPSDRKQTMPAGRDRII